MFSTREDASIPKLRTAKLGFFGRWAKKTNNVRKVENAGYEEMGSRA